MEKKTSRIKRGSHPQKCSKKKNSDHSVRVSSSQILTNALAWAKFAALARQEHGVWTVGLWALVLDVFALGLRLDSPLPLHLEGKKKKELAFCEQQLEQLRSVLPDNSLIQNRVKENQAKSSSVNRTENTHCWKRGLYMSPNLWKQKKKTTIFISVVCG
jgi:hypothetical protein